VEGLFDSVETDALGNLICRRIPRVVTKGKSKGKATEESKDGGPLKVMLLCHMDEIGFYITAIDDKGFLWVNPAGGFDTRNLFSRRVLVVTDDKDYVGVMNPGGRPIHISSMKDREKVPEVKEFFVDVGMKPEAVKKAFKVGDYIVMHEPAIDMGDKFVSKALDNRVACWLGIEAVRKLEKNKTPHACEVIVAFTTQEEVGLRGAKTASHAVAPDIGLGIDVTLACDTPGVPSEETVTKHGLGFACTSRIRPSSATTNSPPRWRLSPRSTRSPTSAPSSPPAARTGPPPSKPPPAHALWASPSAPATSTPSPK
jgi:putative aminopeptidase FrvX